MELKNVKAGVAVSRLAVAASALLTLVGCGGVPPELLGSWKGPSTLTVDGRGLALDSQALLTESGGRLSVTASGVPANTSNVGPISCSALGNVTSTGFEIINGSCTIEGAPYNCNGMPQPVTTVITRMTAVRSDRKLEVTTAGKVTFPCSNGGPSSADFSMQSTLTRQ